MANTNYNASDIQTLEGIAHIRKRPGMYIGSVGEDGIHHITLEILTNFIDEFLNGYGNTGKISVDKEGFITIIDNARGIPIGDHKSGKSVLQAVFDTPNTGGKFNNDGESGYNTSGGMNGIGAKATNALSSVFIAQSRRDGKKETVIFEKGELIKRTLENYTGTDTGTTVKFKPDTTIFEEGKLNFDRLNRQVHELAFLCSGLRFVLKDENEKVTEYNYDNGIMEYVTHLCGKHQKLTNTFYCSSVDGRVGVEVGMAYTNTYAESFKAYTNNVPNSKGTHLTGFRTALTRAINDYARDKKLLKEKEDNLTGEDLKEGLTFVLSLKMVDPVFEGQTKDNLTSSEGRAIVERLVSKEIRTWLESSPNDAKAIINKALLARKARESAKRAREATRKKSGGVLASVLPGKLADCSSKNVDECEIYLVEGDSAGGSAKQARDRATQAILPLRGKVINAEKTDFSKLLENKEIKDMITAFGCGINKEFDIEKLRYGKIIIMTDGDVDGSHIRTLLLTFLYKYYRPLIEEGHVYAAMPPLYRVATNKEAIYLQDDAELAAYKEKNKGKNLIINRFKGLGEMNPEQLEETTMGKETRTLKQITIEDFNKASITFNQLMGSSVEPRKQFIEKNAHKANLE